jgi:hypothetical protein
MHCLYSTRNNDKEGDDSHRQCMAPSTSSVMGRGLDARHPVDRARVERARVWPGRESGCPAHPVDPSDSDSGAAATMISKDTITGGPFRVHPDVRPDLAGRRIASVGL